MEPTLSQQPVLPPVSPYVPGQTVSVGDAQVATQQPTVPLQAQPEEEDSNLDEEWARRAKDVIQHTKDNPFQESQELSKIKAGYIKQRYNKIIEIAEEAS